MYGGWSLTSSNGDYRDGWVFGDSYVNNTADTPEALIEQNRSNNLKGAMAYSKPTQLCIGEIAKLISWLESEGFYPRRARVMLLKAKGKSNYHRDYPGWLYGVRLHIPIKTNSGALFICDEGAAHLPADGSAYLLRVNRMHQVVNSGDTDRLHFICDFFDTKKKTSHHQFTDEDKKCFQKVRDQLEQSRY